MPNDAQRNDLPRTLRLRRALLLVLVLGFGAFTRAQPLISAPSWEVSVQVAELRLSFGNVAAADRNRTVLFDIGQIAGLLGWAR